MIIVTSSFEPHPLFRSTKSRMNPFPSSERFTEFWIEPLLYEPIGEEVNAEAFKETVTAINKDVILIFKIKSFYFLR